MCFGFDSLWGFTGQFDPYLVKISRDDASLEVIGALGPFREGGDPFDYKGGGCAFDNEGTLWMMHANDGVVYTVDKSTAVMTYVSNATEQSDPFAHMPFESLVIPGVLDCDGPPPPVDGCEVPPPNRL